MITGPKAGSRRAPTMVSMSFCIISAISTPSMLGVGVVCPAALHDRLIGIDYFVLVLEVKGTPPASLLWMMSLDTIFITTG